MKKTNKLISIVILACILICTSALVCACDYPPPVKFGDFELYLNSDGTYRILSLLNRQATDIVIPSAYNDTSIVSIGQSAFRNCENIVSVTIPDGITAIGYSAFYGCSNLTSITIPDTVTTIDSYAFEGCGKLTSIYFTGDIAGWCGISGLFYLMSSSRTLYVNNEELTGEVIIPDTVAEIKTDAFYGCASITSVIMPNSVKVIGDWAFFGCSGLSEIEFKGTVEQWNAILKGGGWNCNVPATKVICSDGEVAL